MVNLQKTTQVEVSENDMEMTDSMVTTEPEVTSIVSSMSQVINIEHLVVHAARTKDQRFELYL